MANATDPAVVPPAGGAQAAHATQVSALAAGEHGDPFSFLGMHKKGKGVVVRVFRPRARSVSVLDAASGAEAARLEKVDEAGLFEGRVSGASELFEYRLKIEDDNGVREEADPYSFWPVLGELDRHLMGEGTHLHIWQKLGAHPCTHGGVEGVSFAVWAPSARRVSVVGPFNHWDGRIHPMRLHPGCGVWEIFVPDVAEGEIYKFEIKGPDGQLQPLKADPMAFYSEHPPETASKVHGIKEFSWSDEAWMAKRKEAAELHAPMSFYEVHLGSWRRKPGEGYRPLTYRELADELIPYAKEMGFTHLELLPVSEFPFDGSWGYQPISLFAPTCRHGTPEDFMYFVNRAHEEGLGVIMDWVVGHFPEDAHGLVHFDGTHLYEHADPRQGRHTEWGTLIYNYGRREVANYLLANALFWIEHFHIDGLRVDAVASMLYLDYSREDGEWIPNEYGGNENLAAIAFLKRLNETLYEHFPGAFTVAEESTSWPMVSRPTYLGGLGFGYKWNMGWMNDTLTYISHDPIHRRFHHNSLTFGLLYAFHENFVLPISHDEVVHGKGSLYGKMPGDHWQKVANVRAYLAFQWTHPGKKLLFMGQEIAQQREWAFAESVDWHLTEDPLHGGMQELVRTLNGLYRTLPALHRHDHDSQGFEWIDCNDSDQSTLSFLRKGDTPGDQAVVILNFTPVVREDFRVGLPHGGRWRVALNTDETRFGGSGVTAGPEMEADDTAWHGRDNSATIALPPLAAVVLVPADQG